MAYERTRLLSETEYERLDISPFLDEIEFLIKNPEGKCFM